MREQVCIILNERENLKRETAVRLLDLLKNSGITASRLEVSEQIVELAVLRRAQVYVLDYLLGDFSTGLDILYALSAIPEENKPLVYFLTDEPSVPVAVEAMRLGCKNYYPIERKDSLEKLAGEIKESFEVKSSPRRIPAKKLTLDSLIAQSDAGRALVSSLKAALLKRPNAVVILGLPGSGKSAVSEALHAELCPGSMLEKIELAFFDGKIEDVTGFPMRASNFAKAGLPLNFEIDGAEFDNGEVLVHCEKLIRWQDFSRRLLTVTTSDAAAAKKWAARLKCDLIAIPALEERKKDITALAQYFAHQAEEILPARARKLSVSDLQEISALSWPGDLKQLRAVVQSALLAANFDERSLLELISEKKQHWEDFMSQPARYKPPKSEALWAFQAAGKNYRAAAASLGCAITDLQEALNS